MTPKGRRRFQEAAAGLARIAPRPDVLLTSPLPRALETAQIAAAAWGRVRPTKAPALASGSFEELEALLGSHPKARLIGLVGHEPHVSSLAARLLGSSQAASFEFRKGGAALLEVPGKLAEGARLLYFIPPRVLRALR